MRAPADPKRRRARKLAAHDHADFTLTGFPVVRYSHENRYRVWVKTANALLRDTWIRTEECLRLWEETHNPAYLWDAIRICTKRGDALPSVVMSYLADVATRMSSPEARAAKDLHKVLPGILGFPAKRRGPGRLLDPDALADPYDTNLAVLFAIELEQGRRSVSSALASAVENLPVRFVNLAEATLKRRIMKAAQLKIMPRTADEWRSALRPSLDNIIKLANTVPNIVSRNSV